MPAGKTLFRRQAVPPHRFLLILWDMWGIRPAGVQVAERDLCRSVAAAGRQTNRLRETVLRIDMSLFRRLAIPVCGARVILRLVAKLAELELRFGATGRGQDSQSSPQRGDYQAVRPLAYAGQ